MLGDTFFLFDLLTLKPIFEGEELSKNIVSQMQCFTLGVVNEKKNSNYKTFEEYPTTSIEKAQNVFAWTESSWKSKTRVTNY